MGCVANISERHDTHPYLRKHNLHGRVLHLFESADIGLLRELRCVRAAAGVAWRGVAWRGVAWRGVAWRGVAWRGVVWCGVVWCGVV